MPAQKWFAFALLGSLFLVPKTVPAEHALTRYGRPVPIPFTVPAAGGEAILEVTASTDADWGVEGRESAVVEVAVDGQPRADLVLFIGPDRPHSYRTLLGHLDAGKHEAVLRFSNEKSPPQTQRVTIADAILQVIAPTNPRYAVYANAPYLHGWSEGNHTDAPMLLYAESWKEGADTHIQYTIIFSNEDSRADERGLAGLFAEWGHTSDIEFIYGVRLDGQGRPIEATFQDRFHRTARFAGSRVFGDHPEMWVVTRNGLFTDNRPFLKKADTSLAAFLPPDDAMPHPPDRAREAFMAAHPWTYEVAVKEMERERMASGAPKVERPTNPDTLRIGTPRDYAYVEVEATSRSRNASLVFGIALRDNRYYRSDHGDPKIPGVNQARFAQTTIELPPGTKPEDIAELTAVCRTGSVSLLQVRRVFLLGPQFEPRDVATSWTGELLLSPAHPSATLQVKEGKWVPKEGTAALVPPPPPKSTSFDEESSATEPAAPSVLSAERTLDNIEVDVDGKLFTTYRFDPKQKYPYLWPVRGPRSDRSLTTESSEPWPHHHSLFFGCDRVNGWNFWQEGNERGQIVSRGPTLVERGPTRIVIADICDWRPPAPTSPVLTEHRTITIQAPSPSLRFIDFATTLTANEDVKIEKTNHSFFAVRMEPHLGAARTGTMINAEGLKGEKATFGKKSAWMDCFGDNGWGTEGLALFDHPSNRWFPSPWFTRDYGFISPTPMNWLDGGGFRLAKGESLTLHYRVVAHSGDCWAANLAKLFAQWENERF